jgi:quercetin dioxygenase-like cupin family protein
MKKLLTIAAGLLLVVSVAAAQTITPPAKEPVKRTPLQKTEYPDGHVVIMQLLETDPNTAIARHIHPGVETSYVL